ncbi:MAG: type II toxin-antitoxin system RelE/ParE family toxin [Dehalococcoidia bacterium]|nr:type II toxin-antitoxin system RelE/ParE family toxin [Dehalococcoidia bacterium]
MQPLRFEDYALNDAEDIAEWCFNVGGEDRATDFIERLEEAVALIRRYPGAGHRHRDLPPGMLMWTFPPWSLVFGVEAAGIVVYRIVARGRDLRSVRLVR